jgi:hypothetical protein
VDNFIDKCFAIIKIYVSLLDNYNTMTNEIKSTRNAKPGEKCFCTRCNGKGHGTWHTQFGLCFKCFGNGYFIKPSNEPKTHVIYKVKAGQDVHCINLVDKGNKEVPATLWIGDIVTAMYGKAQITGIIVGKFLWVEDCKGRTITEKKSAGYDQIEWI